MTLLDFFVILGVLIISLFAPLPWGVGFWILGALIIERWIRGERVR